MPPREVGPMPTFNNVSWKNSRNAAKKSTWSLIWAQGHAVEIINAKEGKQFHAKEGAEPPAPKTLPDLLAESEYCTKAMYTSVTNVCRKFKKSYPQKYSVTKYANTRYRQIKNAVITHLKETHMGSWPERVCKPEF